MQARLCAANKVIDHQKKMAESAENDRALLAKRIAELGKERSLQEKKISELALKLDIASINLAREHQSLEKREQTAASREERIRLLEEEVKQARSSSNPARKS